MTEIYNIGVSALLSSQRVLGTIGHNIANANTEGYTRQRVDLATRPPQMLGGMFFGRGVDVRSVDRVADQFLIGQIRTSAASEQQLAAYYELAKQVTDTFGDATVGLSSALQQFYNALQDVNDDPSAVTARQVLLNSSDTLVARIRGQHDRLNTIRDDVNARLKLGVDRINSLAQSIADVNKDIIQASAQAFAQPPNDLLDERDRLLVELAEMVSVTAVEQSDGQYNVTIGNGQLLVAGSTTNRLTTIPDPLDPTNLEIAYQTAGAVSVISDAITGGQIGGMLAFRGEMLDPAQSGLGRIAATLAMTFNAQHREGMDLGGALGGDYFGIDGPHVLPAAANTGTLAVAFDPATVGALTTADYRLRYDGAAFVLTNLATGTQQTLSGAGPFTVDGLRITVTGAPAAGDNYLLQPTRMTGRTMDLAVSDARRIAVAAPVTTAEDYANIGSGAISRAEVLNAASATLLAATTLVFNNPPSTFQVNGAGPLIAYGENAAIDVNGWRVRISGAPAVGDRFTIASNTAGIGDNANGLLLSQLQGTRLLDNGAASYQEAYGALVGGIGARTQQTATARDALTTLRTSAVAAREATSGVNLDEEAANLLKFQQVYQAAARVIQIGSENISALLDIIN